MIQSIAAIQIDEKFCQISNYMNFQRFQYFHKIN